MAWPKGVRVDTWVETGSHVTPYYDSLLAKLMVFAPTRPEAIAKLVDALSKTKVRRRSSCAELLPLPLNPGSGSRGLCASSHALSKPA